MSESQKELKYFLTLCKMNLNNDQAFQALFPLLK